MNNENNLYKKKEIKESTDGLGKLQKKNVSTCHTESIVKYHR